MAVNMGSAIAYLELDTSKFSKGFASAKNDLKVFASSGATVDQKLKGLSSAMTTVGGVLTRSVTLPLVATGTAATVMGMNFESAMSQVAATMGKSKSEIKELEEYAKEMGATTVFSATEAAQGLNILAQSGLSAKEQISALPTVLDLAAAGALSLESAATYVTASVKGWGDSMSNANKYADLIAKGATLANTNVSALGESFSQSSATAKNYGQTAEGTTLSLLRLAEQNVVGAEAATALNRAMMDLYAPTDKAKKALDNLGISAYDNSGKARDFNEVVDELNGALSQMSEEERNATANAIFTTYGLQAFNKMAASSTETVDKFRIGLERAGGSAAKQAATQLDNLKGDITLFKSAMEGAGIAVSDVLIPSFRNIVKSATDLITKFNNLDPATQKIIVKMGVLAASTGPVLTVGGRMVGVLSDIGKGFVSFNTEASYFVQALGLAKNGMRDTAKEVSKVYSGLTKLLNPMNLVIAGLAAGTVAIIYSIKQQEAKIAKLAEQTEAEKVLADAIHKQNEQYTQSAENRQIAIDSATKEGDAVRILANKLSEVVDENGRIMEGKETYARFLTGELSEALGQEIEITDGVIQKYGELMGSIDQTIQKQKALAVQEALKEDYTTAIINQADAQMYYNDALSQVLEQEKVVEQAKQAVAQNQEKYDAAVMAGADAWTAYRNIMQDSQDVLDAETTKLERMRGEMDEAKETLTGYNETVQNYEGLSAALISDSAEEIDMALLKVQNSFQTAETGTRQSLEKQVQNLEAQYQNMQEAIDNGSQTITQSMLDNMSTLIEQANTELNTKIEAERTTLTSLMESIGIEAPQGMIDALLSKESEVVDTAMNILNNMQNGAQLKGNEIEQLFKSLGIDAPTGLTTQLAALQPSVQKSAISLLTELQNAESSRRPAIVQQLKELGIQMDTNLASGLQAQQGTVTNQATAVGKAANKAIGDQTKIAVDAPKVKEITNASEVGRNAWNAIKAAFSNPITAVINAVTRGVDGSHAGGLDYVPFNGYIAELHEGERVLTKAENQDYSNNTKQKNNAQQTYSGNSGGDTFNFYNVQPDPYEYARQMKKAKKELLYNT